MPSETPVNNLLTFDVEDWHDAFAMYYPPGQAPSGASRLAIGVDVILAALDEHGVRATFFVLGCTAQSAPGVVRRIAAAGHEIGTHGWSHVPIYRQARATFRAELDRSRALLQDLTGQAVRGHRAALFSITARTLWALDELAAAGMAYDSSIFPIYNYRYGMPRAARFPHALAPLPLWEYPISTLALGPLNWPFSGGFYARLWPYGWIRAAIRRLNRAGCPAVAYFHPWEFDPGHPRLGAPLPWLARATHYHRLGSTRATLHALLRDCAWGPIACAA
jgi:polysaccharide deacetylase family protein (PEP-CTERM system associated)